MKKAPITCDVEGCVADCSGLSFTAPAWGIVCDLDTGEIRGERRCAYCARPEGCENEEVRDERPDGTAA